METIAAFILAGGESRRMGTDKSQLILDGQSFLERIAATLAAVTQNVIVVGKPSGASMTLQQLSDVYPQWGALGGVHTALASGAAPGASSSPVIFLL